MRSFLKPVPWFLIVSLMTAPARADKKVFHTPKLGTNLGVWCLTADPTVRHHANYHNTQCWSPDGLRQRQTDVYVAVVRKPDRPWLRAVGDAIELVPGEHHAETRGYRLLKAGRPYADRLIQPGMSVALDEPGEYQAVAVEWSGVESDPSNAVPTRARGTLQVLADQPAGFAWSTDRWTDASQTIKETVHRHAGVIRREFYASSALAKAHDLNAAGQAIRRVSYRDGQIAEREYYTSAGMRVSREILAPGGHVAEMLYYARDGQTESAHWWFDRGQPVKLFRGGKMYVTRGDRFGRIDGDRFVDTPRGPYSE